MSNLDIPSVVEPFRGYYGPEATLSPVLADLDRRLHSVEQLLSDPGVVHQSTFDTITINTSGSAGAVVLSSSQASPIPAAPTITLGTFYEDVYADVDWDPPADGTAATYQVDLLRDTGGAVFVLDQSFDVAGTATRFVALRPNTTYKVRVYSVSPTGVRSTAVDSLTFLTLADATTPAQTTGLILTAGLKSILARWTGVADPDVINGRGYYQVHLDTVATFDSQAGQPLRNVYAGGTITSFSDLTTGTTYHVRVRAVDSSGNVGAWSTSSSIAPGGAATGDIQNDAVTGSKIAVDAVTAVHILAGAITADELAAAAVTADKIAAATITGDKIAANTIVAEKLQSSTMTTVTLTINGGSIKVGNPGGGVGTSGVLLNSQGIRLYSGTSVVVSLDVSGAASFTGDITGSNIFGTTTINIGAFQIQPSFFRILSTNLYASDRAIRFVDSGTNTWVQAEIWAISSASSAYGTLRLKADNITMQADSYTFRDEADSVSRLQILPGYVQVGLASTSTHTVAPYRMRVGNNTSVPSLSLLEVTGSVGGTMGVFRESTTGEGTVLGDRFLGVNMYNDGTNWKSLSTGWSFLIYGNAASGNMAIYNSGESIAQGSNVTLEERVYIAADGRFYVKNQNNYTVFYVNSSAQHGFSRTDPAHTIHVINGAYTDGFGWVSGSSRAIKKRIRNPSLAEMWAKVDKLAPVLFNYIGDDDVEPEHVGLIAEESPEFARKTTLPDGRVEYGIDYGDIASLALAAVKALKDEVYNLNKKVGIL